MPGSTRSEVPILVEGDIVEARRVGRQLAESLGFGVVECTEIATAISELARNIVLYAGEGRISVGIVSENEDEHSGIEVVASDEGPGIESVDLAMQDGYSSSRSLGLGLPGTRRLMDEFEIDSVVGKGTTVTARKWRRDRGVRGG